MAAGEQEARDYLQRHRIPELLHRLGALLLYHRPGAAPRPGGQSRAGGTPPFASAPRPVGPLPLPARHREKRGGRPSFVR